MAVLSDAVSLKEKGYATMAKSTVVPFELPSEFSPDPLTEVIQNGANEVVRQNWTAHCQRCSRKFGPGVKMDRMMKVTIQNDKTKEPFARTQSPCCA